MDCNESMTSTGSLELKATINNDLPWKMVAKGSRSSTRRTKKQVARSAAADVEAEYKSAAEGDTGSEKLGVSVLSQHLAERVDHVPIKKRRFMVPAPSPMNVSSKRRAEVNHALPVSRLNPNLMAGKTPKVSDGDKPDCGTHDFSGIEILAEVACSSGMSSEIASVVDSQIVEPVRQQDALTLSGHVEGNDSSTGTVDVSGKDTTVESGEKGGESKREIVGPQNASAANQREEHTIVASSSMMVTKNISIAVSNESSTERPKEDMEAGDYGNLAPQSVTVSENLSGDECTGKGKKSESLTNDRLLWDLNLPTDAWGQSCDVVDETSRRYSDGEVTESVTVRAHVDGSKDYATGPIASDVHMNSPLSPGHKAEASTQNGKEFQSGYDSQFEDGELREPYPWEENEGDSGDVEQVDYGSEPENERFYSLAECNENKLEDVEKGVVAQTKSGAAKGESGNVHEENSDIEKHVVVCMNDSHSKGSSPSRSFGSKPFRDLPSHEPIRSRRPCSYEEMNERDAGPNKFVGRERTEMRMQNRSPRRGQFSSRWDSEHRFSPSINKRGQYGFGRPPPKTIEGTRVRMSGFDQPGPDPSGPQGYVRRHFSNGGYRGRFRRFPDGNGNRDFRGAECSYPPSDTNDYPSRMHHNNRMNSRRERSNSPPVFRRLHDPQSRSRPRSRSPVSWNGQNRSPPGFRADETRMERVRVPFQKRFPLDQEMGFMSPQRNQRNSRFYDSRNNDGGGENHHYNNFRGRKSPPGRMFRQEQRFDNNMRRVNSENNGTFRPFVRHNNNNRRFGDDGGGSRGEGCRYENMYEMVHRRPPPRGLETVEEDDGGNIRRFRSDAEQLDTVVANDNKNNNDAPLTNKV